MVCKLNYVRPTGSSDFITYYYKTEIVFVRVYYKYIVHVRIIYYDYIIKQERCLQMANSNWFRIKKIINNHKTDKVRQHLYITYIYVHVYYAHIY